MSISKPAFHVAAYVFLGILAGCGAQNSPNIAPATTVLQGCQAITQSGHYTLAADVSSTGDTTACITIHNVDDVDLDCAGHALTGGANLLIRIIDVDNVHRFSIKHCTLQNANGFIALAINDSSEGTISDITTTFLNEASAQSAMNFFDVGRSRNIVISGNTINGYYSQGYSDSITISNNKFIAFPAVPSASVIALSYNTHTTFVNNTIDGRSDGVFTNDMSTDDGILMSDESNILIADNSINNVFDTGIETLSTVRAASILRNHITNTGFSGIGGWYYLNLTGSTIAQNVVEKSPVIFYFMRDLGLRPAGWDGTQAPADTGVYFQDNVFDGNVMVEPLDARAIGQQSQMALYSDLNYYPGVNPSPNDVDPLPSQFFLTNNTFKNNNFGHQQFGPSFGAGAAIPGRVIDGGGNICTPPPSAQSYPLACQ